MTSMLYNPTRDLLKNLTLDQIQELEDCFATFDIKNQGFIESVSIRPAMRSLGFNPLDKELQLLEMSVDHDSAGRIDFKEFVRMVESLKDPQKLEYEALDSFRAFDVDNRGYIAAYDIRDALMQVMETASQREKDNVIKAFRLEKNRKISYDEFKEMITPKQGQETET